MVDNKEFIDVIAMDSSQVAGQILGPIYYHAYFQRMLIHS